MFKTARYALRPIEWIALVCGAVTVSLNLSSIR